VLRLSLPGDHELLASAEPDQVPTDHGLHLIEVLRLGVQL